MGSLKLQSLVSCVSEEVQTERVSQMGFRLLSLPVLVGGRIGREGENEGQGEEEGVKKADCNNLRWLCFTLGKHATHLSLTQ